MLGNWVLFCFLMVALIVCFLMNTAFVRMLKNNVAVFRGPYKQIFYASAAWNMFSSVVDVLVPLTTQSVHYAAVFYVPDGWLSRASSRAMTALLGRLTVLLVPYGINAMNLIYRLVVVWSAQIANKVLVRWGLVNTVGVPLLYSVVLTIVLAFCFPMGTEINDYLRVPWNQTLGESIDDANFIVGVFGHFPENSFQVKTSWIAVAILSGTIAGYICFYLLIGVSIEVALNQPCLVMSLQKVIVNKKILKMVLLMTSVSVAIDVQFFALVYVAAMFDLPIPSFIFFLSRVVLSMSPILSPLSVVLYFPPFRRVLITYFRKPKPRVSPYPVASIQLRDAH